MTVATIPQDVWDRMPWHARERAVARARRDDRAAAMRRRQKAVDLAKARLAAAERRKARRDPICVRKDDGWWLVEWRGQTARSGSWETAMRFAEHLTRGEAVDAATVR